MPLGSRSSGPSPKSRPPPATLGQVIDHIRQEYQANLDRFSQQLIVAQLRYSERFYERQFIARQPSSHQVVTQVAQLLGAWLADAERLAQGVPTVRAVAEHLHASPDYLSGLLRQLAGRTTQLPLALRLSFN